MKIEIKQAIYFDLQYSFDIEQEEIVDKLVDLVSAHQLKGEFLWVDFQNLPMELALSETAGCEIVEFLEDVSQIGQCRNNFLEVETFFQGELRVEVKVKFS